MTDRTPSTEAIFALADKQVRKNFDNHGRPPKVVTIDFHHYEMLKEAVRSPEPPRITFPESMSMAESHGDPRITGEPLEPRGEQITEAVKRAVQITLQIGKDHWLRTGGPIKPEEWELVASDVLGSIPAARSPEPRGEQAFPERLHGALREALRHATVPGLTMDDEETPYPFVDHMSDPCTDIGTGERRIEDFADAVGEQILELLDGARPSEPRESLRVAVFDMCWPGYWITETEEQVRDRLSRIYAIVNGPDDSAPTKGAEHE